MNGSDSQDAGGNKNGSSNADDPGQEKLDIGAALRSVYEDAAGEDIPSEMLDLLGKLD